VYFIAVVVSPANISCVLDSELRDLADRQADQGLESEAWRSRRPSKTQPGRTSVVLSRKVVRRSHLQPVFGRGALKRSRFAARLKRPGGRWPTELNVANSLGAGEQNKSTKEVRDANA
jgi:hypothetical protein